MTNTAPPTETDSAAATDPLASAVEALDDAAIKLDTFQGTRADHASLTYAAEVRDISARLAAERVYPSDPEPPKSLWRSISDAVKTWRAQRNKPTVTPPDEHNSASETPPAAADQAPKTGG